MVPPSTPARTRTPLSLRTVCMRTLLAFRYDVLLRTLGHHITVEEVEAHAVLDNNFH